MAEPILPTHPLKIQIPPAPCLQVANHAELSPATPSPSPCSSAPSALDGFPPYLKALLMLQWEAWSNLSITRTAATSASNIGPVRTVATCREPKYRPRLVSSNARPLTVGGPTPSGSCSTAYRSTRASAPYLHLTQCSLKPLGVENGALANRSIE